MTERSEVLVRLSDLGDKAVEQVRRETGDYVVPIICGFIPLGSGTLVEIDKWRGILTAEHVVRPSRNEFRLDYTGHPERFLRTAVGPFAHDLSITTNALRFVTTKRERDDYGPDLAFIALPPSPFLGEIAARKSFYNLTLRGDVSTDGIRGCRILRSVRLSSCAQFRCTAGAWFLGNPRTLRLRDADRT